MRMALPSLVAPSQDLAKNSIKSLLVAMDSILPGGGVGGVGGGGAGGACLGAHRLRSLALLGLEGHQTEVPLVHRSHGWTPPRKHAPRFSADPEYWFPSFVRDMCLIGFCIDSFQLHF